MMSLHINHVQRWKGGSGAVAQGTNQMGGGQKFTRRLTTLTRILKHFMQEILLIGFLFQISATNLNLNANPDLRSHYIGTDFRKVPAYDAQVEAVEKEQKAKVHRCLRFD